MRRTPLSSGRNRRAFTLVELLAAIAVLALLMSLVFGAYNKPSRAWSAGERRTEAFQNARLVLETMGRELESAVATSNAITGRKITLLSYANESSMPASAQPGELATVETPNDQLFFVAARPDTSGTSDLDLAEYGYFVAYAKQNYQTMRAGSYYLLRHFAASSSAGFDIFSDPLNWDQTPGFSTSTKVPILENVLRLEFRFQMVDSNPGFGQAVTNGSQVVEQWNNNACPGATPSLPCSAGCARPIDMVPAITNPEVTLPRAVHIRMAMIDRRTAERVRSYGAGQGWLDGIPQNRLRQVISNCADEDLTTLATTDPVLANMIRENVHVFYKTVYLRNSR